jgi:hypothetical protein
MTAYHTATPPANPPPPKSILNGRGLKGRHLSTHQRAELAVGWIMGTMRVRPSFEQAATIFDVPKPLLREFLRARNGGNGHDRRKTRVDRIKCDLQNATPAELAAVGTVLGPALIWDRMISPVLDQERTAAAK